MSAEEIVRAWKDPGHRDGAPGDGDGETAGDDHPAWHDAGHPAGAIELDVMGGNAVPVFLDTQWQCTHSEYPCTVHPICP